MEMVFWEAYNKEQRRVFSEETHILGVGSLGLHGFGNLYRLQAQIGKRRGGTKDEHFKESR